jgi:superfamily II DNA or RNA helicase
MILREYQERSISELGMALKSGVRNVCLMAPTGSGKTAIAMEIINRALAKGKRVMFICDRVDLIDQTSEEFEKFGIDHGVIQGNHWRVRPGAPVQVCSIQTLARRRNSPFVDLVIVDEAHTMYKAQIDMIEKWDNVPFIGLTATPFTKGMGKVYGKVVVVETTQSLIDQGYLCPFIAYGPPPPDLSGVKTMAGDYNQKQLSDKVNEKTILGDVVRTWLSRGEDRQTICFAVDIAHSKAIVDEFRCHGVNAAHIDAYTDEDERKELIRDFKSGKIKILSSVDILTKGFNNPEASCLIMARPTKSLIVHIQQIGRVLRIAEGKKNAIILDHGGNMERLGFPTDALPTLLCHGEKGTASKQERKDPLPKSCPKCDYLKPAKVHECPQCGFLPERQTEIVAQDVKLERIERINSQDKERWYSMLLYYAREKGFQDGWASHKYREKFSVWPSRKTGLHPVKPDEEVSNYIKHLNIKQAKSKKVMSSCRFCHSTNLKIMSGKGPHAGQLRCEDCGRHVQWLSKETMSIRS